MKNNIHLEKVCWDNYYQIIKLRVAKEQKNFVATNKTSLAHAFLASSHGAPVFAFAIKNNKTIVGFILLVYDNDWTGYERENWLNSEEYKQIKDKYYYCVWRFMIDKKYQNKGYGREAFKQALDFIKTSPSGPAEYVSICYETTNEVGKKLYASFGFEEVFTEYLEKDDEVTAILKL